MYVCMYDYNQMRTQRTKKKKKKRRKEGTKRRKGKLAHEKWDLINPLYIYIQIYSTSSRIPFLLLVFFCLFDIILHLILPLM